jgi:hypothetical protein
MTNNGGGDCVGVMKPLHIDSTAIVRSYPSQIQSFSHNLSISQWDGDHELLVLFQTARIFSVMIFEFCDVRFWRAVEASRATVVPSALTISSLVAIAFYSFLMNITHGHKSKWKLSGSPFNGFFS